MTLELLRVSAVATRSTHERTAVVDAALIARKAGDARANPRGREMHVLHPSGDAPLQRMLNVMQPETYVRPHRHWNPPCDEALVVLQGALGILTFDEHGVLEPNETVVLDPTAGMHAIDIRAGVWHTVVVLAPDTAVFEVKPGPYVPAVAGDLAPWSPEPGTPGAEPYLAELTRRLRPGA